MAKPAAAENQRETFRVPFDVRAELFHDGEVTPCLVRNMSAGGVLLQLEHEVAVGEQATLGLHLFDELREAAGIDYLSLQLEVLESIEPTGPGGTVWRLRCRNLTTTGSPAFERAHRVVVEADRQRLADASGAAGAGAMATDSTRRNEQKLRRVPRHSRASVNHLFGE